jgi:hypothetical protein
MDYDQVQDEEWTTLYEELQQLLARHGQEDAFGEGDFWLVDDNYGSPQHKVCVSRVSFLTQIMASEVQQKIRAYSLPWEVIFAFDRDERLDSSDLGVVVRKVDIQEDWDSDRMRRLFGSDFRWHVGTQANSQLNRDAESAR